DGGSEAPAEVERVVAAARGGGQVVPPRLRRRAEQVLGADLGRARLHSGPRSARANQAVGAAAFTVGDDVHLGPGLTVDNAEHVIAHELAHVAQRAGGTVRRYILGRAVHSSRPDVLLGQDRQADNSFRDPADAAHADVALSRGDATGTQLRISEDGKMAVEDVGTARQAKVFFASRSVISKANKALADKGSSWVLHVATPGAITVCDDGGKRHTLDAIEPIVNPLAGSRSTMKKVRKATTALTPRGAAITVDATCVAVAENIVGGKYMASGFTKIPKGKSAWQGADALHAELGLTTPAEKNQWIAAVADAVTKGGARANGPLNEATVAQAYGTFANANPVAALAAAKRLGVNESATPKVGQAYVSESMGADTAGVYGPGLRPTQDWLSDPTGATQTTPVAADATGLVRGGMKRSGWGNHVGAVVAASAGNTMTLENYARWGEDAGNVNDDKVHYFAMYGSAKKPSQTWHHAWSRGSATPIPNAVTTIIG
ncbi:MAG: hypothetical protein JWO60_3354, partial [Frankiales bacterium]|nr:hypothetical protein [Frankiales bacterium]